MKKTKDRTITKISAVALLLVLAIGLFASCSGSSQSGDASADEP